MENSGYLNLEILSIERIKGAAGPSVFEQGEAFFNWGRVQITKLEPNQADCTVLEARRYEVTLSATDKYLFLRCSCEQGNKKLICKHQVAAYLSVREHFLSIAPVHWSENLNRVLQTRRAVKTVPGRKYLLLFSLQASVTPAYTLWRLVPYTLALSSIPKEHLPETEQPDTSWLSNLLRERAGVATHLKTPYQLLDPENCINAQSESVLLANLIIERGRAYTYYTPSVPIEDYLTLLQETDGVLFAGNSVQPAQQLLQMSRKPARLCIHAAKDDESIRLNAFIDADGFRLPLKDEDDDMDMIALKPLWLRYGEHVLRLENTCSPELLQTWLEVKELNIPVEDENDFLERYYLRLVQELPVEGDLIEWESLQAPVTPRLYLSDAKGKLQASLRFGYGEQEVSYNADLPRESIQRKAEAWTLLRIQRDVEAEAAAHQALASSAYRLKRAPKPASAGDFVLRANAHPVDFLLHSIPRLAKDGFEVFGEERLKTIQVNRAKPSLSFKISSGIDWFDVKAVVNFGELEVSLKDVRRALKKKERYVKLADGSVGELPEEWIDRYRHLFALSEETSEGLRVSSRHITILDQALDFDDSVQVDAEFKRRRERLRSFTGIQAVDLPESFQGDLRPYQKAGFDWLHFLHEFEFGGILADDMGLGKTVQVLAFLQSLRTGCGGKPVPQKADLIIVPRSLLVNWQREAARFTPELRILEYFNGARTRDLTLFDQYDVVITTYGVMLRDIKGLATYPFNTVVLDESQAIKNPAALTSRAVRQLRGNHRLALTGTPVENSSVELWSQFAFLNPGLLGSLEYFQTEFATPIEKKNSEEAAAVLRRLAFPFILRRTKDQVAPELPPRTERILYCDMEPAQRKLYNRTRDYYRGMLLGMMETEGLENARMKILEGLLRLRQVSIHPKLMDANFRGPSAKFELLLETLDTLHSEGHKALVFSQFVQMLKLVQAHLDERHIPYEYLDGSTRNRQERVDHFQEDESIPFFLISLKAGGQGLNLTAADYVIHIDPWWNPAVEMQATDRTHRIGQEKPVFVYKLIARDSVEEKLLLLQAQKKQLVEQIISVESSFFKAISEEDVRALFS